MIVRRLNGDVQLVRQVDHDDLSGQLAEAWGGEGFWAPDPRDDVIRACAEHDDGWHDWEREPGVDPESGRAWQFLDMDVRTHLSFYRAGIRRVGERSRYAGLLVSMHGTGIYQGRHGIQPELGLRRITPDRRQDVRDFIAEQEKAQEALRGELGVDRDKLWRGYRLLQVADRLSLYFCMGGSDRQPAQINAAPAADGGDLTLALQPEGEWRLRLTPYPFGGPCRRVTLTRRVLPDRVWESDEAFREAFFDTEPEVVTIELTQSLL